MLPDQTQRTETNPTTNLQTKQPATTNQASEPPPTSKTPPTYEPPPTSKPPPTYIPPPAKAKRHQTLRAPEQRKDRDPPSTKMVRGHSPETETQIELISRKPDTVSGL
eukprot:sb/3477506/